MPATIKDRKAFDIRDHQESLTQTKKKGRYICPVCDGNNLTINEKTGAYKCWSGDCESKKIRDAIAPINLSDPFPVRSAKPRKQRKAKKPKPVPLPEKIELARLEGEVTHPQKTNIGNGKTSVTYRYEGGRTVERIDDGNGKKQVYPYYLDDQGQRRKGIKQGDLFPPYRIEEAQAGKAILMLEGEKCVEAARYLSFAATTLQGAAWGKVEAAIARLKSEGVTALFYIPDLDEPGFNKAKKIIEACAAQSMPCSILNLAQILDNKEVAPGYDIADYVMENISDKAKLLADLERLLQLSIDDGNGGDNFDDGDDWDDDSDGEERLNQLQLAYQAIKSYFKPKYNELTKQIEIDGKPCDINRYHGILGIYHGHQTKIGHFDTALNIAAEEEAYHPIRDYLNDCKDKHGDDTSILEGITERYFGATDPIYQAMFKRFLIGAVARVMTPGCKNDTMLILQGDQGIGKSSFFNVLANNWFTDSMAGVESKDDQLIPHRSWLVEWAEFERSYRKADNSVIKAYMSRTSDLIRAPYARSAQDMQRGFVLVGSTNESQFLNDATGSRRFWVIPCKGKIDTTLLEQERDRIWAAALALYEQGENWYLTDLEEKARKDAAKNFESRDIWQEILEENLPILNGKTTSEILSERLLVEIDKQSRREQMRISETMKRLGFEQRSERIMGIPKRVWRLKNEASMPSEIEVAEAPKTQQQALDLNQQQQPQQQPIEAPKPQPQQQQQPQQPPTQPQPQQQQQPQQQLDYQAQWEDVNSGDWHRFSTNDFEPIKIILKNETVIARSIYDPSSEGALKFVSKGGTKYLEIEGKNDAYNPSEIEIYKE